MCGIVGAIGHVNDRLAEAVRAMNACQAHRGPDGEGYWQTPPDADGRGVALGHRRLAILDLSPAGAQPMHDPGTGCVIVFNGEIYNFRQLRRELQRTGHAFVSDCDTEVILKAYAQWGLGCIERFRGMFAFAIWDPRSRQLHLARDRIGIKPLYVAPLTTANGGRTVMFASELRSLLASGVVPRQLDPVGLATYLWNGFVPGPSTIIRGIELLPPGTSATLTLNEPTVEPTRYWRLPSARAATTTVDELREQLQEAVELRLIADVPVGVFLSGGIDSSAVAALAARGRGSAIHTFNIGFDDPAYDESRYAQAVADALGTTHRCIRLTEADFGAQLDAAMASIDQPTFDAINTYLVSRAVREAGVTVALAGTGGDELFGGYTSFVDLPTARRWSRRLGWLPRPLAAAAARLKTSGNGHLPAQTRWGKLPDVLATRGDLLGLYQVAYGLFTTDFQRELYAAPPSAQAVRHGMPAARAEELHQLVLEEPELQAISMLELSVFIGERLMRDTDAASMAVALEVRVPLLDHEVIATVAGLDPERRFEPRRTKQLLREVALADLDPAIFDRPKSGFVLPIDTWCRRGLRDTVRDTLADTALCQRTGLSPDAVGRLWRAFDDGAPGVYWSRIWALFALMDWCRRHNVHAG